MNRKQIFGVARVGLASLFGLYAAHAPAIQQALLCATVVALAAWSYAANHLPKGATMKLSDFASAVLAVLSHPDTSLPSSVSSEVQTATQGAKAILAKLGTDVAEAEVETVLNHNKHTLGALGPIIGMVLDTLAETYIRAKYSPPPVAASPVTPASEPNS